MINKGKDAYANHQNIGLYPLAKGVCIVCTKLLLLLNSVSTFAGEKYFDPAALEVDGQEGVQTVDLSRFKTPGKQLPGIYHVELIVNNISYGQRDINFIEAENSELTPELHLSEYIKYGLKVDQIPALKDKAETDLIVGIDKIIDGAFSDFDFKKQRININIPQSLMTTRPLDYIDPKEWNNGLPAIFTSYDFSGSESLNKDQGDRQQDQYLNLRSGANLGPWRLRNYTTWKKNDTENKWDNINTFLQRDIAKIRGKLTLGDDSTQDDVFDSFAFRGIEIVSEERMLSSRETGFAPVIRGIARAANAQVTVSQGGYTVYQAYVPAGPFEITDLFPSTSGGNLDVTINEADGSVRTFTQSFGSVPVMQREGHLKYELMMGKYNNNTLSSKTPNILLMTGLYGLPYDTTGYGGLTKGEDYTALQAGYGLGLGRVGSVSFDVTQSVTQQHQKKYSGKAYRLKYAKSFSSSGLDIGISHYLYPDKTYYSLEDSLNIPDPQEEIYRSSQKRERQELSLNQSLGDYGSLSLYAYKQKYWDKKPENYYSASYNGNYGSNTFSLMYNYTHNEDGKTDKQIAFNVQIPLENLLPQAWVSYGLASDNSNHITHTVGINGTLLEKNNLNYGITTTAGNNSDGGGLHATYKGSRMEVTGNYTENTSTRRLSYGLRGALLAHPYGVTFSQPLTNDSPTALVRIPGWSDISVNNGTNIKTDYRGYAVIPNIQPYRVNTIGLNSDTLDSRLDVATTINHVIPSDGALVLADFNVRSGRRVLMTLVRPDNQIVPFGAMATAGESTGSSIVADTGLVYLIGMPEKGTVTVKWGDSEDEHCQAPFELSPDSEDVSARKTSMIEITAKCL